MYEAYFQLQRRPFSATPDHKCFYASPEIQEVLDELILRVENGQGIGVLTSAAGTGKTLLCRRIVSELSGRFTPIFLANANFPTRRALLQAILCEMQRRYTGMEEQELRLELMGVLKELVSSGQSALLIIDEAHLLNERLLEEVRTLATLSHDDQPLVRLILSGQLSLEEKLADAALEALNQRVACHVYLEPLTRAQSLEYIAFRTTWAGGDASRIFSHEALEAIAHACNGLPRCLNQLCDHCLLLAYVAELQQVGREIVNDALADLKQLPLHWNESLPATSPLAALSAVARPADSLPIDSLAIESVEESDEPMQKSTRSASLIAATLPETFIEIGSGPGGATAPFGESSIEIGCSESMHDRESWEFRQAAGQEQRMIARKQTGPTVQQSSSEETVHDRYAALDSRSLRIIGTFSDQGAIAVAGLGRTAPENSGRRSEQTHPDPAIADFLPVAVESEIQSEPRPDKIIDEVLPLLSEACSTEPGGSTVRFTEQPSAIDDEYRTIRAADIEDEIEERIGSDVLDVCLDVQQSLGNWGDEITTSDTAVYSDTDLTAGDLLDSLAEDFDVVEPEMSEFPERPGANRIPDIAGVDRGMGQRQVPQPGYKRVFSTLRRKMARQKGQL